MNNENNQNEATDLTSLYGASSNNDSSQPAESINNQQVQVENSTQSSENNIPQPTNDNLNQTPVQEPMVQNNMTLPQNGKKNNKAIIIVIVIIVIGAIACDWLFFDKKVKDNPPEQNSQQQESKDTPKEAEPVEDNTEQENKEKMIKIFKNMAHGIDVYAKNNEYSCNTDAIILPTRFVVEIDTTEGSSIAQQNAKLLIKEGEKSPWDNRDIKGYIIVERQLYAGHGATIFRINLSDGVYGTSSEMDLKEVKEDTIASNVAYPATPSEGIRCHIGVKIGEEEDW